MAKQLNTRIRNKVDTKENWNRQEDPLSPIQGELYIYRERKGSVKSYLKVADNSAETIADLPYVGGIGTDVPEDPDTPVNPEELIKIEAEPSLVNDSFQIEETTPSNHVFSVELSANCKDYVEIINTKPYVSTTQSSNRGSYSVYVQPISGYCWQDETTNVKTLTWTIIGLKAWFKFNNIETIENTVLEIAAPEEGTAFNYTASGTVSKLEVTDDNVSASITNFGIPAILLKINNKDQEVSNCDLTIYVDEETKHEAGVFTCKVSYRRVDPVLDNNSWKTIATELYYNRATWDLGSEKTIKLHGTTKKKHVNFSYQKDSTEATVRLIHINKSENGVGGSGVFEFVDCLRKNYPIGDQSRAFVLPEDKESEWIANDTDTRHETDIADLFSESIDLSDCIDYNDEDYGKDDLKSYIKDTEDDSVDIVVHNLYDYNPVYSISTVKQESRPFFVPAPERLGMNIDYTTLFSLQDVNEYINSIEPYDFYKNGNNETIRNNIHKNSEGASEPTDYFVNAISFTKWRDKDSEVGLGDKVTESYKSVLIKTDGTFTTIAGGKNSNDTSRGTAIAFTVSLNET